MPPAIHAGFECAVFRAGAPDAHDLLASTDHLWPSEVLAHRNRFAALGFQGFRDALTPNATGVPGVTGLLPRRALAYRPDDRLTWDLFHFHHAATPQERKGHVRAACLALLEAGRMGDDLIPFNEPSMTATVLRISRDEAIAIAREVTLETAEAMDILGLTGRIVACDPTHYAAEWELDAIFAQEETGHVGLIGVQHYAHDARAPLRDVLHHMRYHFRDTPIAITETGYHFGHPDNPNPLHLGVTDAASWLRYVLDEVEASCVPVESVCWYPALPHPPWHLSTEEAMRVQPWLCGWPEWVHLNDVLARQGAMRKAG